MYFNPRSPHGERHNDPGDRKWAIDFNPRSPHGERQFCFSPFAKIGKISIHAPRTGSDRVLITSNERIEHFNPRSPHGERRAGTQEAIRQQNFNPRSPHGERPPCRTFVNFEEEFQSTLPARGATRHLLLDSGALKFQSTLPARGATRAAATRRANQRNFNPRSPHGERLYSTGIT